MWAIILNILMAKHRISYRPLLQSRKQQQKIFFFVVVITLKHNIVWAVCLIVLTLILPKTVFLKENRVIFKKKLNNLKRRKKNKFEV